MSLRLKLVTLTVCVALLPLAVSAWTSLSLHQTALEQQLTDHHARLAESAASLTEQHLESAMPAFRLATVPIRWSELSAAERQGALWLVYRQLEDSAVTSLLDAEVRGIGPSAYLAGEPEEELAQHPRASLESLQSFAKSIPFTEVIGARRRLRPAVRRRRGRRAARCRRHERPRRQGAELGRRGRVLAAARVPAPRRHALGVGQRLPRGCGGHAPV